MGDNRDDLTGMSPNEAAAFTVNNDISELFAQPEAVPESPPATTTTVAPATTATALRVDLGIQAELESAAAARGIGSSTLMVQILEDWVAANREMPAPDQLAELVRHLDAARQLATSLSRPA